MDTIVAKAPVADTSGIIKKVSAVSLVSVNLATERAQIAHGGPGATHEISLACDALTYDDAPSR